MKLKCILSFLSLILTISIVHAQSISITGSTINSSNTVTTGISAMGDYTLNWSGLTGNITLTSNDANVEFSNDGGSSFNTSLSISSGLGSAIIEIRINPSSANGTNSVTLTNTSVSNPSTFTTLNFDYIVIASTQPSINSTLLTSNVSANGMDLSFTGGDGSKRIVVAKAGSAVDFIPTDGVAPLTANANINLAGDLGNGNKLIYDGSGSGMAVTGLSHNTTYHFAIFEYNEGTSNSQNYFTSSFSTANQATTEQLLVIANDNGTTLNTNFDNISNSLISNFVPNGWYLAEQGGNTTYDVSDGATTTENSYSFGSTSSTDRAIGSITENTITPIYFGTKLINNSGATVTSIFIEYVGEQWRLGATGRTDKLTFQYSTNATSINDNLATWTAVTALDFTAPVTTGSVGALNGNLSANQTIVSGNIESISIPNSGTVWLRWTDNDVTGNDDGLAIDEVNITPFSNTATGNLSTSTYSNINVTDNVTLTQNTTVNNTVNVKPGKTVDLNGHNLIINGAIIGSPIFVGNNASALTLAGTGAIGNIRFDQTTPGTTNVIKDLTVNKTGKTVTLENALQIADNGTVTVSAGTLVSGGNLTLTSTLTGTARIAELGAGASITGNVEVQRYMVGGASSQRGWRCMSTPVSGATYAQLVDDIFITGPGGAANGFDANGSNSSVMYYEESATRGWKSITNPTNTWTAGKGALVFFRGDRTQSSSLTNTNVAPNSFALDYSGNINSGDVTVPLDFNSAGLAADQGWNLIGNPYPSQIDWANVNRSVNTDSYYYILNPNTKNYVSQNTGTLAIGQAFFVLVDAATSITFQENDKTANTGTAYFKTAVNPLTIKMKLDNVQYDVATLNFESNSSKNYVFKEDAVKLKNSVYNLAFVTPNNKEVQYNVVNYLGNTGTDTFDLNVTSTTNTSYTLNFTNFDEVPLTKAILLVDKLNNNLVNLRITPDYTFTINNNTSTTLGKRFALVITDQYTPLPVKLTSFAGKKLANANQLSWTTTSEKNMVAFEIERSNDGKNFEPIGLVKPTNTNTNNNYTFNDITAKGQVNYYRLKMVDAKNTDYSGIVSIANNDVVEVIEVYPNPTNKYLTINVQQGETLLGLEVFSLNGTSLLKGDNQNILDVSTLANGLYIMIVNTLSCKSQVKFQKN